MDRQRQFDIRASYGNASASDTVALAPREITTADFNPLMVRILWLQQHDAHVTASGHVPSRRFS